MRTSGSSRTDRRTRNPKLFRKFWCNGGSRRARINGKLKWTRAIPINVNQDQWFGRIRQAHWHFRDGRRPADRLRSLRILEPDLILPIIETDPVMLQKIVAEIAINF